MIDLAQQTSVMIPFHDVANIFPLIEGQEFAELVGDIRVNGLKQSIWTYQGKIIDGRNRYRACLEAGVEPCYQEWDGNGSLVAFTISLNVKRRHLTSSQLSVIALGVEKQLAVEAAQRTGGRPLKPIDDCINDEKLPQKIGEVSGESAKQAADLLGTNHDYVSTAKKIENEAPELLEHIMDGTLTTPDAKAIADLPKERQAAVVEKAVRKKKETGKRASKDVKDAVKEAKAEAKREQRAEQAKAVMLPSSMHLLSGDFRLLGRELLDESVDLIFTDPPYHEGHLPLWSDLGSFASRVLKPGGMLLAYSGQIFLPQVLNSLSEHLVYCWLLGVAHTGGHIQIWQHKVWNDWKPIVMFSKGKPVEHDWLMDLYRGDKGDKEAHEWSQGEGEAAYFIEKLSKPGQLIVDPMCGSGTILRASYALGRKSLGMEIDEERYTTAMAGMKEVVSV